MIANSNLQGVPLLVLANKQDLPGNKSVFRRQKTEEQLSFLSTQTAWASGR